MRYYGKNMIRFSNRKGRHKGQHHLTLNPYPFEQDEVLILLRLGLLRNHITEFFFHLFTDQEHNSKKHIL